MTCNNTYKLSVEHGANHASCVPISSFVAEVADIITKIEGLEYSCFVGKKRDEGNSGPNIEANADLWDCLKYI